MRELSLVLLGAACMGHGWRLGSSTNRFQNQHPEDFQDCSSPFHSEEPEAHAQGRLNTKEAYRPFKALKRLLLALNQAAAFNIGGASFQVTRNSAAACRPSCRCSLVPTAAAQSRSVYEIIRDASVLDPRDGTMAPALDGLGPRSLFVLMPQLGDFDSMEYAEQLAAVLEELPSANIDLRIVGIGDAATANRFASFWGLPLDILRVDPDASLHRKLGLHAGPGWNAPEFVPEDLRRPAKGWLNYLAMCLFISTPGQPWTINFGTLREVFRGFLGDRSCPERLTPDTSVKIGPVTLNATGEYSIGPFEGDIWFWKEESGYLRPVELAAVRLRTIAEVWFNLGEYVKKPEHVAQRGATFLFEEGQTSYEWRDRGLLQYSETMKRPLSFLQPYIGSRAINPLQLKDSTQR